MKSKPLTKAEVAWLKKLEKVLLNPPSDRLGMYVTGDARLEIYDRSRDQEIETRGNEDFCHAVERVGAYFCGVLSACQIGSTSG